MGMSVDFHLRDVKDTEIHCSRQSNQYSKTSYPVVTIDFDSNYITFFGTDIEEFRFISQTLQKFVNEWEAMETNGERVEAIRRKD